MAEAEGTHATSQFQREPRARGIERLQALPQGRREVVEAAALLNPIGVEALTALIEAPGRGALEQLQVAGLTVEDHGQQLDEGLRTATLTALEARPQRLAELHARASAFFARRLGLGDQEQQAATELSFTRHLDGQCEALARYAPHELNATLDALPLTSLARNESRLLIAYYRGLAHGLNGDPTQARQALDQLLREPQLTLALAARIEEAQAEFAQAQHDTGAALASLERGLALWEQLLAHDRQARVLLRLGTLLHSIDQLALAELRLLAAMEQAQIAEQGAIQGLAQFQLGQLYRDAGRWADALDHAQQASETALAAGDADQQVRASILSAQIELLRGQLDAAAGWLAMAMGELRSRDDEALIWITMGLICQAEGTHVDAIDRFETALAAAQATKRNDLIPLIDYRMGLSHESRGHFEAALARYNAAANAPTPAIGVYRLERLLGSPLLACEAALGLCLQRHDAAGAFEYAERARALAQGLPPTRLTTSEIIPHLPSDVRLLTFYASGQLGAAAALLDALPADPPGLRDALTPPARLTRILLGTSGARAEPCLLDPKALRAALPDSADPRPIGPAMLQHLFNGLIAPVAAELVGATLLLVVPHPPLDVVPFAALTDADQQPLGTRIIVATHSGVSEALDDIRARAVA